MPEKKETTKNTSVEVSDDKALMDYLSGKIPTAETFKAAGILNASPPAKSVWVTELKAVKQDDVADLDPVRVEIAVQRVMVSLANNMIQANPDETAKHIRRKASALIPIITRTLLGA